MNKKNKNKNRSKPTNPTPVTQKPESVQVLQEGKAVLAEEKPLSLVEQSDSVVESTNVTTESVQGNDEIPTDTPKKPKRNKGKKKKQEETNLDEYKSASIQDLVPVTPSVPDSDVKHESVVETTETIIDEEDKNTEDNITANVRKKKNKKKPHEQHEMLELSQEIVFAEKIEKDLEKEESVMDNITKSDINTPETIEFDIKLSKKKNKKKKHRRDSDKSDKADEVVICTAAFQKLISSTDNEVEIDPEKNTDSPKDIGDGEKHFSTCGKEETFKDLIESVLLSDITKPLDDDAVQSDQMNESKSKKKTKKDKKQQQQQQSKKDNEKSYLTKEQVVQQESLNVCCDIIQELPSVEQANCTLEDIPKPKAKIAKPVEKKRKGKPESFESCEIKLQEDIISVEDIKKPLLKIEKLTEDICLTVSSFNTNVLKTDETEKTERKNEANVIISNESSEILIPTDIIIPSIETSIEVSNLNLADVNIGIKSNEQITESSIMKPDSTPLTSDKESENISSVPPLPLKVSEQKDNDTPIVLEPYKTVEKRKKKHPKKIDVSAGKTPENKVLVTPESEPIKAETPQKQKEDMFSGLQTLEDVEISSLKTEELDGSSDATPDFIHHPLATSQQFIDDNNNMTIREITSTDEKLSPHLLIDSEPIIQDSGETPEPLREKMSMKSSSPVVIREKSLTNETEKTDLKSKMMEVSQDMEELRLSIERSLAELTSMEKNEPDVVKGSEEIEAPKLVITPEIKTCAVKGDILEKSEPFSENILVEDKICSTSEVSTETIQATTKHELPNKTEIIVEKNVDMLASAKSDEREYVDLKETPPQVPARKDHKGKGKGKRKCKQETQSQQATSAPETSTATSSENKEFKKQENEPPEQKSQSTESNENKGKQQQQAMHLENNCNESEPESNHPISNIVELSFDPIEHFEDALTSSVDDVNKTFEAIANEVNNTPEFILQNQQINITSATDVIETAEPKQNPVSPPKNLLGHPDIPVPSNRTDYKKEKNKPPNMRQAKVKIKDAVDIERMEKTKQSKESQTENKIKVAYNRNVLESFSYITNENSEYVYKYSFRKVFLQSLCHVCRKELGLRVPCPFCSLVFYCSQKHKDEDWPQHQSLCFAICTIAHLKDQKHIYADAKNITGQNYRLLRMQMIVSCEKVLKRKLVPWEQEALLYPRICADVSCREWKQSKLADCENCGQISYCSDHPAHLPTSHQRWCRSYALYQKLVHHQQTRGRLEPKLPSRIVADGYRIPEKINEVLAAMYDKKIDMTDMEYAALTQLATAPLTAAYCHQIVAANHANGIAKKTSFVVHIVGAELQFEADVLFKWEVFFLHLKPDVKELRVVLISPDLNPSNLPLNLLEKVSLCESCRAEKRRVLFNFQDNKTYYEYWAGDEFFAPDIVCAFNPSIQRASMYNGKDTWPTAVSCILKLKTPLIVSSYSIDELNRDIARIKECSELSGVGFKIVSEPKCNPFASVRPDRNFITDDEMPLLFKNYCFVVLCGV